MKKTILITGSTDGIGLETAKMLATKGHRVLLHGRSREKLEAAAKAIDAETESYLADLSRMADVAALAEAVTAAHPTLDVLINNAGIFKAPQPVTPEGLDIRFVVNTIAPYALTRRLLPSMKGDGRIINLSSAAQAPVNIQALYGKDRLSDMDAYAQSKLALTMWSRVMADGLADGPVVVALNPGSLLASKMVKEGFGVAGNSLGIGVDILCRAALSDEFASASGKYFDNDAGAFGEPHPDASDPAKSQKVFEAIEEALARLNG
ncbi:MAG: SDR family NAD(P)-dependent oxidoreductase [Geminicoccaceae bacterium]